jgi:hypothetical protein
VFANKIRHETRPGSFCSHAPKIFLRVAIERDAAPQLALRKRGNHHDANLGVMAPLEFENHRLREAGFPGHQAKSFTNSISLLDLFDFAETGSMENVIKSQQCEFVCRPFNSTANAPAHNFINYQTIEY